MYSPRNLSEDHVNLIVGNAANFTTAPESTGRFGGFEPLDEESKAESGDILCQFEKGVDLN